MKYYIDPTTKEVFAYEANGSQDEFIKPGLVPISDADLAALRESQVDPIELINVRLTQLRTVREKILSRLGDIAGRAARKSDRITADACDVAAESLLDITKDLPSELQAIELAVLERYKSIASTAALAAPSLDKAFAGVDL